jgi:cytochrome c-type protein NapC
MATAIATAANKHASARRKRRARFCSPGELGWRTMPSSVVGWVCLVCIAGAAAILVHHLVTRPPLNRATKLRLAVGLGLLPALSAMTSSAEGMRVSTERNFCGSCHVMDAHVGDAEDPTSQSLAARHARNPFFGDRNCYVCHADYGMYGYALTKLTGMKHVYAYYMEGFSGQTLGEALPRLHLYEPYDNDNCMQCHSTELPRWQALPEHGSLAGALDENRVSCASAGCHGVAHPFSKRTEEAVVPKAFAPVEVAE